MQKRAQITTFIILGIIVLAIVALFIYLTGETATIGARTRIEVPADVAPVQVFVERCLETVGDKDVRENSMQGGYYSFEDEFGPPHLVSPFYAVPVYYNGSVKMLPSKEEMEHQLSLSVSSKIGDCISNFESLKGYNVTTEGNVSVSTILNNNSVLFKMNYPLQIRERRLTDFVSEVPLRMGAFYSVASQLGNDNDGTKAGICLTCYSRAAFDNNIKFDYISNEDYYTVIMKDLTNENNPYYFMYAVKAA